MLITQYLNRFFTSNNDVVAAVARALLQDLRSNGFTFDGFPSVLHGYINGKIGGDHEITLSVGGKTVGPFVLSHKDAVAAIKDFHYEKKPDLQFVKKVQKWVIELEIACDDRKAA